MQLQQRILFLGGKTGPHLPYFKGKIKSNKKSEIVRFRQ
jgi:hypothetical protein